MSVTVKGLKAKASKPTVKAAKVKVAKDASGEVLGVAIISCTCKGDDKNSYKIEPESAEIMSVRGVEAAVSEVDPTIVNITKLDKQSGAVRLKLTFKGGVTKILKITVKKAE